MDSRDEFLAALARSQGEDNARRFFREHQDMLIRVALALRPTGPGDAAERRLIRERMLPAFEAQGWELTTPLERMATGERDLSAIIAGVDRNSALVVRLIAEGINARVDAAAARGGNRAQSFFDANQVEMRRIRQLASRERATSTGPRFEDSFEGERSHVRTALLPRWERMGWRISAAVEALWSGTTDAGALCDGLDPGSARLVRLLLESDQERPPAPPDAMPTFRAVRAQTVTAETRPGSRGVGRLGVGDVVTAVDGRRVEVTDRLSRATTVRIRIGEDRWVTERSSNGPVLLELQPRARPSRPPGLEDMLRGGVGAGGGGGRLEAALLASLLARERPAQSRSGVDDLRQAGDDAVAANDLPKAVEHFSAAIAIQPTEVLYCRRSAAQLARGAAHRNDALSDAQLAIGVAPTCLQAYICKAEALRAVGKLEEALEALDAADSAGASSAPAGGAGVVSAEVIAKDEAQKGKLKLQLEEASAAAASLPLLVTRTGRANAAAAAETVRLTVSVQRGSLSLERLYEAIAQSLSVTKLQVLDVYVEGERLESDEACSAFAARESRESRKMAPVLPLKWSGAWQQAGDRGEMDLYLREGPRKDDGPRRNVLTGKGGDAVGGFTVQGSVTETTIQFVKRYLGQHAVIYEGTSTDGKAYTGTWKIEEGLAVEGSFDLMRPGALSTFRLTKDPNFGMALDDAGAILRYEPAGGPAELAGVPVGATIRFINSVAVRGKAQIMDQLAQIGAGTTSSVDFTVEHSRDEAASGTPSEADEEPPVAIVAEVVDDDDVPENFVDPIMSLVFVDPVVAGDGMTYERSSIARWLKDHDESPQTRQKITPQVFDNHSLRSEMQRWFERERSSRRESRGAAVAPGDELSKESSKARLEAEVERLEGQLAAASADGGLAGITIPEGTPGGVPEGTPPASAEPEPEHTEALDAAAAEAPQLRVSNLLDQLERERQRHQDAEAARRAVEEERAAMSSRLEAVEAEAQALRAKVAPAQEGLDLRSALGQEAMEQLITRLREERDAALQSVGGAAGGGMSPPDAHWIAQAIEDRSAAELRRLLTQLGGRSIAELLAGTPRRAALERHLHDAAADARKSPRWVPDSNVDHCMLCAAEFGLRRRRHHCRACGWVACAECCSGSLDGLERFLTDDGKLMVLPEGAQREEATRNVCLTCVEASARGGVV